MHILFGSDPEIFIEDMATGKYISAHGLVPGSKATPCPIKEVGHVQVDGMALEFNTLPTDNFLTFLRSVMGLTNFLEAEIKRTSMDYRLAIQPSVFFDTAYLNTLPPAALELGCDPDFNAWTGAVNDPPDAKSNMRTGAGHIHIGWGDDFDVTDPFHLEDCRQVVKQLDYFVGLPSLIWDDDDKRRTMYGKAGTFRPKSYGVEYRVLSNAWLRHDMWKSMVWVQTHMAMRCLEQGKSAEDRFKDDARVIIDDGIRDWYNNGDGKMVQFLHFDPWNLEQEVRKVR